MDRSSSVSELSAASSSKPVDHSIVSTSELIVSLTEVQSQKNNKKARSNSEPVCVFLYFLHGHNNKTMMKINVSFSPVLEILLEIKVFL